MALPDLIARLERDAQAKIDAADARSREEIARIAAEADRVAGAARDEELLARRVKRRALLDRELAEARALARARALRAREVLIERVFERAVAMLPALAFDPRVHGLLKAGVAASLPYLGEGCRAVCRPELSAALSQAGVDTTEDEAAPAGVRLESHDRSVAIDLSLTALLARAWPLLSVALAKELPS